MEDKYSSERIDMKNRIDLFKIPIKDCLYPNSHFYNILMSKIKRGFPEYLFGRSITNRLSYYGRACFLSEISVRFLNPNSNIMQDKINEINTKFRIRNEICKERNKYIENDREEMRKRIDNFRNGGDINCKIYDTFIISDCTYAYNAMVKDSNGNMDNLCEKIEKYRKLIIYYYGSGKNYRLKK